MAKNEQTTPKQKVRILTRRDTDKTLPDGSTRAYKITSFSTETGGGRVTIARDEWTPEKEAEEIRKTLEKARVETIDKEIEV